ncbi:RNA polymerase sigma factor [Treponema brennaborense]|uniref:RNA polymerase, sigma-24 subunit, ECF subfamily n=1 Tax=Treponema brennaborense (strain DSM 12168 / CIP 105900 / DD5/3) TaxID=906968 RepID=F4LKV6_TREBD|nr:sigma-70 family RNA polymerase sigma factor [Treponema brennaborense]AEE16553.1 RNA polymerase, sigma-24 subunit, ECF subfamily [Treponema brennaborense DSM 12168]
MKSKTNTTDYNFAELYEKYGPMVLRRCRYLLQNEENAVDAMQDVFARILEHKDSLTGVCASLFYTTATRVCLNKMRADAIRWAPQIEDVIQEIADTAAAHEQVTDAALFLDTIFNGTKESTRNIALIHYVDGLTLEETAAQVGMSVSGIRKRLSALRKKAHTCAGGTRYER